MTFLYRYVSEMHLNEGHVVRKPNVVGIEQELPLDSLQAIVGRDELKA